MLARQVISRSGRRFRGYYPSWKLGRMVAWESLLERDAILLLEFSWGVLSYQEQPTLIEYHDGQRVRSYFPDFEVTLEDGSVIHLEVKPTSELAKPAIRTKLEAVAAHYQSRDQEFRVVTEQEIRREPLLGNVRTLAYLAGKENQQLLPNTQGLLQILGSEILPFEAMEKALGREVTLRLLANGNLVCDLNLPFCGNTSVAVAKEGRHATYLL